MTGERGERSRDRAAGAADPETSRLLHRLEAGGYSLLVERDGAGVFRSSGDGLRPLVLCLARRRDLMEGAVVADRVIGAASARLLALARVAKAGALVASIPGLRVAAQASLPLLARSVVPDIMDRSGAARCPLERLALEQADPEQLLVELRRRMGIP